MKKVYLLLVFTFAIQLNGQNIYTYAGNGTPGFSGDGNPAISSQLKYPGAIAADGSGNLYICDYSNNRIRKVDVAGIITTIAGGGTSTAEGVNVLTAAVLQPTGITLDAAGNIYYSESFYSRVRKINAAGFVNTIAGNGSPGFAGDGALATLAQLNTPSDVSVDSFGNVYIADGNNNRIRKVSSSGTITTIAGTGPNGFSGDGGLATAAQLDSPSGVRLDGSGNIYIADYGNGRIRMINAVGTITTVAGGGGFGFSGDGGQATLAQIGKPNSVAIDGAGNLYLSDTWNNLIRKISASGIITKTTGTGVTGYSGDGGLATLAQINDPGGITFDSYNNVYFADAVNQRVRIICVSSCPLSVDENEDIRLVNIFPNPASSILTISSEQNTFENSEIEITNYLGQSVIKIPFSKEIDVSQLSPGLYHLKIKEHYSKFVKE